jgi:hypothetical protein
MSMSSFIIKQMLHLWYQRGDGDIWVRGVRGEVGLMGMSQLILSMGLLWVEVCKGLLPQLRGFLYIFYFSYNTCVKYCILLYKCLCH